MPRKVHNALTPIAVKNAGPGRHADGGGLYLRVQGGGARSWLFRTLLGGKARDIGLGPAAGAGALSLADARVRARELASQAAKGEVLEGKRAQTKRVALQAQAAVISGKTFKEVAEAFVDRKEGGWRNEKHRQQWRNTLATYAYPHFGDLPVSQVETAHVLEALEAIWSEKPETATRVRGRIENVLDAAKVQGLRTGENPARWRGHLDHLLPKPEKLQRGHHAALPYAELPAFMSDLKAREALAARALEYTILTAARSGETLGATWAEVDLEKALWTIPAERMKAGKEHRIPLSDRAVAILREVQPLNTKGLAKAPLFPSNAGGKLSGMAMSMLLRRMGHESVTVHGFRSTFRDWAGESTSYPREVVEHAMAHQLADKAEAAYQRGTLFPKRVKLMEAWSTYCASSEAMSGNIISIRSDGRSG